MEWWNRLTPTEKTMVGVGVPVVALIALVSILRRPPVEEPEEPEAAPVGLDGPYLTPAGDLGWTSQLASFQDSILEAIQAMGGYPRTPDQEAPPGMTPSPTVPGGYTPWPAPPRPALRPPTSFGPVEWTPTYIGEQHANRVSQVRLDAAMEGISRIVGTPTGGAGSGSGPGAGTAFDPNRYRASGPARRSFGVRRPARTTTPVRTTSSTWGTPTFSLSK